jgi:hypothetical protein
MTGSAGQNGDTGAQGAMGPTGAVGPQGPTGSVPTFSNLFSVELGSQQSLPFSSTIPLGTTLVNWVVNPALGDYYQGVGLDLATGVYNVPDTGLYHVFITICTNFQPGNASASYNSLNVPMSAYLFQYGGSGYPLLYANFLSNAYSSVGGATNSIGLYSYATATMVGDLSLTAGVPYAVQVVNPFIDSQSFVHVIPGSFTRWSMRQFA